MVNYQVRTREYPKKMICACGCGRAFVQMFSQKNVYATAGCATRAKAASDKRRRQNKENRRNAA